MQTLTRLFRNVTLAQLCAFISFPRGCDVDGGIRRLRLVKTPSIGTAMPCRSILWLLTMRLFPISWPFRQKLPTNPWNILLTRLGELKTYPLTCRKPLILVRPLRTLMRLRHPRRPSWKGPKDRQY